MFKSFLVLIASFFVIIGFSACEQPDQVEMKKQIDSLHWMLNYAEESMAVDPVLLKVRVDSMAYKIELLDELAEVNDPNTELGHAMGYYRTAMMVFRFYVESHDVLMYENQSLDRAVTELDANVAAAGSKEYEKLKEELLSLTAKVSAHKLKVKQLMRQYIDIVRPYNRIKDIVEQKFKSLVKQNNLAN